MNIKSLEELKKIREEYQTKVGLRQNNENSDNDIEVLIGMATCGISSGARETLNTFAEELNKQGLSNVKVIPVGCIGYCHAEPTVQVFTKGQKPVLYGNVVHTKVQEIIEKHIKGGMPVEQLIIKADFERT